MHVGILNTRNTSVGARRAGIHVGAGDRLVSLRRPHQLCNVILFVPGVYGMNGTLVAMTCHTHAAMTCHTHVAMTCHTHIGHMRIATSCMQERDDIAYAYSDDIHARHICHHTHSVQSEYMCL